MSVFDDTPKNLLVIGDSKSGVVALFHEEHYVSKRDESKSKHSAKEVSNFLVSLVPRILLVPSISEEIGPLLDHCLVRAPAQ